MSAILTILLLAVGFVNLLVAVGVFLRSTKGGGRWTFLALIISTSLWAWMVALFVVANSASNAQLYANIFYTAALFIASGLAVFGQYINGQPSKLSALIWYVPALGLIALFVIDPEWLIAVTNISPDLSSRVIINPLHYVLYSTIFLLIFIRGWLLLSLKKSSSKRHRHRRQTVSLGLAVAGIIGLIFNLFLPWMGNYDLIAIGPIFSLLFTFSVTYAISRYSLFDLRQTFVMSLAYLLASSTAALFYLGVVWSVGSLIADGTNDKFVIGSVYVVIALTVAMTINPLKGYFDTLTDKLFLHERHKPEEALDSFGDAIIDDVDVSSIAGKIIASIDQVVHPEFAAVVLADKDNPDIVYRVYSSVPGKMEALERLLVDYMGATEMRQVSIIDSLQKDDKSRQPLVSKGIAIVARMQLKDQKIGYIILGDKRNGDAYMTTETLMLSTMADESALAVMNSLRFDEIQKFNARLKHDVAAATKELRASNKELMAMDATKDEFVSMASHQLRTPLTSVKGYISMVLEGDVGEITKEQRQLLGEAFTSSERMVHLIGDFLNVSRLQTGKFIIDTHLCDLAKVVDQEVDGMRQIASTHAVKLVYKRPARFPELYIDENKIRQVIMNFVDNAIYYSPESKEIKIALSVEDGDAVLRVTDKGMGVPAEVQKKLFTKFFRAENARKQRPDGTGIGLYLSRKVIDGHHGSLVFESREGKGSTFGFRLPIKKLSDPPSVKAAE